MLRRRFAGALIGAAVFVLPIAVGVPAASASTTAQPEQTTTLYYDDSQAAEFQDAVAAGAEVWNSNVENVQLVRAEPGQQAEIEIIATDGWPMATLGPVRPGGSATFWFGREAVVDGYDPTRIAAHELGHNLGLPDVKPGPCSSLMSGSTGGVDCTNATPNEAERAEVEANYGSGAAGLRPADGTIIVDGP